MITDTAIAETLSVCLPLPRTIRIGDQRWTITVSAVLTSSEDCVSVRLLLSGPYERHRRARLDLGESALLAKAYDPDRAAAAITAWLPHSDEDDVLALAAKDLVLPPSGRDARAAGDVLSS